MLKSSMHQYNTRYRGPAEADKHSNFNNEVVHDLILLINEADSRKSNINNNLLYSLYKIGSCYSNMSASSYLSIEGNLGVKNRLDKLEANINSLLEQV